METVGQRISAARGAKGWTQEELASAIGRQYQQVSGWERSNTQLRMTNLYAVSQALGVRPEWIRSGKGPMRIDGAAENITPYQAPPQIFDLALMESAILHVLLVLDRPGLKKLPPERITAGVLSVYESAKAQGRTEVTEADVTPLVRLLMA